MGSTYRTEVVVDDAAIDRMFGGAGDVARFHLDVTERVYGQIVATAPVGQPSKTPEGHPAGWLRDNIAWEWAGELTTRISTSAVLSKASHRPGDPYARWIEKPEERPWKPPPFARNDEPYLVPGLMRIFDELD